MDITNTISMIYLKESRLFYKRNWVFLVELRATAGLATGQKIYTTERKIRKLINCYYYFIIWCQKGAFVSCHNYI